MHTPRAEATNGFASRNTVAVAAALVFGSVLFDLRAALLVLLFLVPALVLSSQGRARFRTRRVAATEGGIWADALTRAGPIELVEVVGPLLFLSVPSLDRLLPERNRQAPYMIIDLRAATALDASALRALRDVLDTLEAAAGAWLLVCAPHQPAWRVLQGAGLSARALGGTSCFTLEHALERIAQRHPAPPRQEEEEVSRQLVRPRLTLVRSGARAGE